ncbi:unnamed protein product [Schistocephalus solidus]|uniref:Cilia- and flagella-associated protein 157 n=1 Tax=Schistocephalus solidus TaxID=70667 RepID=A0A183SVH1_SCHSO|nr:unnamed protein product [Schistocephalus solidus]
MSGELLLGTKETQTKEILLANIHKAEGKMKQYQEFHDFLLSATNTLEAQRDHLDRAWRKQIGDFSQRLAICADECSELTDQIHTVKFLHDVDQEEWSCQTEELQTMFQEIQERLATEKAQLEKEINTLKDFERRKFRIQAEYASLQKELLVLEGIHAEEIKKLEKKYLLDKAKLKKRAISDIRHVSQLLQARTSATRRKLREGITDDSK